VLRGYTCCQLHESERVEDETARLAKLGNKRERQALLAQLFTVHRNRLRQAIDIRFDRHLRARVDPSDVLQEAFLEASRRLDGYLQAPQLPFYLWLRSLAGQAFLKLRRRHLDAKARDVRRQVSIDRCGFPSATSQAVAALLIARELTPSDRLLRDERQRLIEDTLEKMEEIDREVLALKHFEQLSNQQIAALLGITEGAVRQRHVRAVSRFRRAFKSKPDSKGKIRLE